MDDEFDDSSQNSGNTGKFVPRLLDGSTGKFILSDKQHTGQFVRPKRRPPSEDEADEPTQKIILFPTEESQKLPNDLSMAPKKPPIILTGPLPKLPPDLPQGYFPEEEEEDDEGLPTLREITRLVEEDEDNYQEEASKLASILKELGDRADLYADQMFSESESEDLEDIERLERLIPGTDQETPKRVQTPSREKRKPKPKKELPPDVSPRTLGKEYGQGLKFLGFRRKMVGFFVLLSGALTLFPTEVSGKIPYFAEYPNQMLVMGLLLLCGVVSASDLLWTGLKRSFAMKMGVESLVLFSAIFSGLDCFLQYGTTTHRGQAPYVVLVLLQIYFLLYGSEEKRRTHRMACRVSALVEEPYLITLEPKRWNLRSVYSKTSGFARHFTSQLQQDDGGQIYFSFVAPVFLLISFGMANYLTETMADFVWAFSALLLASTPLAGGILYGKPAHKIGKRLDSLRSALAGWPGVAEECHQCVIGDLDLFPAGSVRITGAQEYNGVKQRKVMAYTASLVEEGGLGCSRLFREMMMSREQKYPACRDIAFHDAGGISGKIGIDTVFVGGAAFTELMDIAIPEGLYVNHAIFCSINGKLAGFFALDYNVPYMVSHSLDSLLLERMKPVLATRDFALTPQVLKQRFHLNTQRMDFPSVLRRLDLSKTEAPEVGTLTGIVSREGLEPVSDCIIGAKRLRKAVRTGCGICFAASVLGFSLVTFLVYHQAYSALAPDNLLFFMLLWLAPVWINAELSCKF